MDWKKCIKTLGGILCSFQLYTITRNYLSFGVITKVSVEMPDKVKLPSFTLCELVGNLISTEALKGRNIRVNGVPFEKLTEMEQENYFRSPIWFITMGDFLKTHTVSELQKLVQHKRSQVNVYQATNPLTYGLKSNVNHDFESRDWFIGRVVCTTISPKRPETFVYEPKLLTQSQLPNVMALYSVQRQPNSFSSWIVVVTGSGRLPLHISASSTSVEFQSRTKGYLISYKQSETRKLAWPYVTNCWKYEKDHVECREHAYYGCLNNMAVKYWNSSAVGAYVEWGAFPEVRYENMDRSQLKSDLWRKVVKICAQKTSRPDCVDEHYSITSVQPIHISGNTSYFAVVPPVEPTIITKCCEEMILCDFLVAFGSTLGYWLGFNVVTSCIDVLIAMKALPTMVNKKCEKVHTVGNKQGRISRGKVLTTSNSLRGIDPQRYPITFLSTHNKRRPFQIIELM